MVTKMSEKKAKQLVNRAVLAGEGQWRDFEESFREMLSEDLDGMDLARSGELDELKAFVRDMESQFLELDGPLARGKKI